VALTPTEEEIAELCHMDEAVETFGILLPNEEEKENIGFVDEGTYEIN